MTRWRNYSDADSKRIRLPQEGSTVRVAQCPTCGNEALRWYSYASPFREEAVLSFAWCTSCRRFHSQTYWEPRFNLPDPLAAMTEQERDELEGDLDRFFSRLDDLWAEGALPQILGTSDSGGASPSVHP